jgi:hypothetical protein
VLLVIAHSEEYTVIFEDSAGVTSSIGKLFNQRASD